MFTCKISAVSFSLESSNANGLAALFGIRAIFTGAILEGVQKMCFVKMWNVKVQ